MALLEYFAGFFDGEGSCGIYDSAKRKQTVFRVSLCNNDPRPLAEAKSRFGGVVRSRFRRQRNETKNNYEWYIYGKNAERFLQAIRPFVLVKGEQIDVFLTARKLLCGSGNRMSDDAKLAIQEAEVLLKQMKRTIPVEGDCK